MALNASLGAIDLQNSVSITSAIRASLLARDVEGITDAVCKLDEQLIEHAYLTNQNILLLKQIVGRRWEKAYPVMVSLSILDKHTDEIEGLLNEIIEHFKFFTYERVEDENYEGDRHIYSLYLSRKLLLYADFLDEKNIKDLSDVYLKESDSLSELDLAALLYLRTGNRHYLSDLKSFLNVEGFISNYARECLALI